jgi:hypothetical protein
VLLKALLQYPFYFNVNKGEIHSLIVKKVHKSLEKYRSHASFSAIRERIEKNRGD